MRSRFSQHLELRPNIRTIDSVSGSPFGSTAFEGTSKSTFPGVIAGNTSTILRIVGAVKSFPERDDPLSKFTLQLDRGS